MAATEAAIDAEPATAASGGFSEEPVRRTLKSKTVMSASSSGAKLLLSTEHGNISILLLDRAAPKTVKLVQQVPFCIFRRLLV